MMDAVCQDGTARHVMLSLRKLIDLVQSIPLEINYWQTQNAWHRAARTQYNNMSLHAESGEEDAKHWMTSFRSLGERLFFDVPEFLPNRQKGTQS